MVAPAVAAALIQGGGQLLGNIMGNKSQADIAREQSELEQERLDQEERLKLKELGLTETQINEQIRQNKARESAYGGFLGRGEEIGAEGEQAFGAEASTALPELGAVKEDVLSGQTEAMQKASGQIQANLAQQGVRGGQAATHLRRGIGEIATGAQRDITGLEYEDAAKRAAERRAYQASKGAAGTQAQLTAPTY